MKMSACLLSVVTLAGTLSVSAEVPGALKISPIEPSDGPVLLFYHPEDEKGRSVPGGGPRLEKLYLYDPGGAERPSMIWSGGNPRVFPLARITRQDFLVEFEDQLYLVNVATGEVTPLLVGEDSTKLVSVEGNRIYFLRETAVIKRSGLRVMDGGGGKRVPDTYDRPKDLLYVYELGGEDGAKQLSDVVVEKLLVANADGFWVLTADEEATLTRIGRDGVDETMATLGAGWVLQDSAPQFSPSGKYLALSMLHRGHDFNSERGLVVCDLKAKNIVYRDSSVLIHYGRYSGYPPPLARRWKNDHVLAYGSHLDRRMVDVLKGKRLEKAPDDIVLFDYSVPAPKRARKGRFELEKGLLFFPGENVPIASVLDEKEVQSGAFATSEEGDFGAYVDPKDKNVYAIDGVRKVKKIIASGWSYDLRWFSVGEVDGG